MTFRPIRIKARTDFLSSAGVLTRRWGRRGENSDRAVGRRGDTEKDLTRRHEDAEKTKDKDKGKRNSAMEGRYNDE